MRLFLPGKFQRKYAITFKQGNCIRVIIEDGGVNKMISSTISQNKKEFIELAKNRYTVVEK